MDYVLKDTRTSTVLWQATEQVVQGSGDAGGRLTIDSPDDDPLRYEKCTFGEGYALVLSDASLNDLAGRLVQMNVDAANIREISPDE